MNLRFFALLVGAIHVATFQASSSFRLRVTKSECLEVQVREAGSQVAFRLLVPSRHGSPSSQVNLRLEDPDGLVLEEYKGQPDVSTQLVAEHPGFYRACLENRGMSSVDLEFSLDVVPVTKIWQHVEEGHVDTVQGHITSLVEQMQALKLEQTHLKSRDAQQYTMVQHLHSRILLSFWAEFCITSIVALVQVLLVVRLANSGRSWLATKLRNG